MSRCVCALSITAVIGVVGSALAVTPILDIPDSQENGVSGVIETADTPWSGTSYDIRHVSAAGAGHPQVITTVSNDIHNDLGARLVIDSVNGDSWVAWWRDLAVDQVIVRKRNQATGAWSSERVQSVATEGSRHPSVAFDGSRAWIAYEVTDTLIGGTILKVKAIEDDPAPFALASAVATTLNPGFVHGHLEADSGHLWLTWVDSDLEVGWSQLDAVSQTWTAPAYESHVLDTEDDARERIRASVLAN
jgi:hypothetical protein